MPAKTLAPSLDIDAALLKTNKNAPAMVGAFLSHHRKFTCGCNNNIRGQTSNSTCCNYTTSLSKIEGKDHGPLTVKNSSL